MQRNMTADENWAISLLFLYLVFVRVLPLLGLLRRDNGELAIVLCDR